jgi:hypothetical protein
LHRDGNAGEEEEEDEEEEEEEMARRQRSNAHRTRNPREDASTKAAISTRSSSSSSSSRRGRRSTRKSRRFHGIFSYSKLRWIWILRRLKSIYRIYGSFFSPEVTSHASCLLMGLHLSMPQRQQQQHLPTSLHTVL